MVLFHSIVPVSRYVYAMYGTLMSQLAGQAVSSYNKTNIRKIKHETAGGQSENYRCETGNGSSGEDGN